MVSNFFYPEDFRPENYIYLSITLALNILLTSLIIGRLSYCKHKIRQLMEEAEVNHYTFVSTMFIESAAPNVLCSIAMIISVAANTSYFQIGYAVSPAVQVWDRYHDQSGWKNWAIFRHVRTILLSFEDCRGFRGVGVTPVWCHLLDSLIRLSLMPRLKSVRIVPKRISRVIRGAKVKIIGWRSRKS